MVHQGEDTNVLSVRVIENAERETAEQVSPNRCPHAGTDFWVLVDLLESLLEVEDEVLAQAGRAAFLEAHGFKELRLGQRVKNDAHSGQAGTGRFQGRIKEYAPGLAARDFVASPLGLSLPFQL